MLQYDFKYLNISAWYRTIILKSESLNHNAVVVKQLSDISNITEWQKPPPEGTEQLSLKLYVCHEASSARHCQSGLWISEKDVFYLT